MGSGIRLSARDHDRWEKMEAYSRVLQQRGYEYICGVDEAGRGPLAGPVVAAACILKPETRLIGLNDSKKMTKNRREHLYEEIIDKALSYSISVVSPQKIDLINIYNASRQAMQEAVMSLHVEPDYILTDAMNLLQMNAVVEPVIRGDALHNCIAAASVLAKVSRDELMTDYSTLYPEFDFASHKGYPTAKHYEELAAYGPTPIHRKSYLKDKTTPGEKNDSNTGGEAEKTVAINLSKQGYLLRAHNYNCQEIGELDLVMSRGQYLYIVEVKARKKGSEKFGGAAEAITPDKIRKIKNATQAYLKNYGLHNQKVIFLAALVELDQQGKAEHIKYLPFE